ncbi:MAG TPA: DUF58 domain-containing protein [Chloroflexi bacterium]|jgi:uncharacterized protein (DUF58 family)|nr:DUF58 domain-containing protein [Chloroflexota bacterium]
MRNLLAFILGLFVVAILFRVDFFFYLLYLFFGIYFLSHIWLRRAIEGISCAREYQDRAFPGEKVTVTLQIQNRSLLPIPWLRIHDSAPIQLKAPSFFQSVASLLPRESLTLHYELDCRQRGYYHLGPLILRSGDLFGMRTYERRTCVSAPLLVYPRVVPLTAMRLPAQTPFGEIPTRQRIFEDPSRMVGVRAYQSGDSLRHIHWKTSATTGSLQVKRFEPAISIESQILLDLDRDTYSATRVATATELAIVTAASIAHYLTEKRQTVGLACNGVDPLVGLGQPVVLPARRGREHLMTILDALARVQSSREVMAFGDLLRQSRLHMRWGGTGIIIAADADDALFDGMVAMKRAGFHVLLVLVDPRTSYAATRERAKEVGIPTYLIWQESDLDVWR